MIVLLPVSRHRIEFETASGRPYSVLERLVLDAIHEGTTSLTSLHDIFQIPDRLLIEALVTLTQAGWLAIGGKEDPGFMLTAEGATALVSGQEPRSSLTIEDRSSLIVMEHLTGSLILNREIFLQTDKDISDRPGWDKCLRLRPNSTVLCRLHLDQSEVQHLLPRGKGEWIRSIGPISLADRSIYWAVVSIDLAVGRVVGLPNSWRTCVEPAILREIQAQVGSLDQEACKLFWTPPTIEDGPEAPKPPPSAWPVRLTKDNFLLGGADHHQYLRRALATAQSSVLIASAFVNVASLRAHENALLDALSRGVNIDLLWGYDEGPGTIDWLHRLSQQTQQGRTSGKVRFNRERSQSHAKLILWDNGGTFEACVGSHNWLSTKSPDSEHGMTDVSVILNHTGIVASLCRCAAAFWRTARSEVLSSTTNRWARIAADIEQQAAKNATDQETIEAPGLTSGQDPNAKVRLILDRDHEYIISEWLRQAGQRLLVASHKLGPPAIRRLRLVSEHTRTEPFQYAVVYGETELIGNTFDEVSQLVGQSGGRLAEFPGFHAKVVVADDLVCISSFNPLYGAPFEASAIVREVGIVIEGAEPADWLWNQFQSGLDANSHTP